MDSDDIWRGFQHSRPSVVFNGTVLFHSAVQLSSKDNLVLSLHFFLEQHFNVPFLRAFGAPLFHYGNLRPELAYCLQSALLQVRTSNTDRKCLPSMSNILIWFSVAPIWSSLCRLCSKKVLEKTIISSAAKFATRVPLSSDSACRPCTPRFTNLGSEVAQIQLTFPLDTAARTGSSCS